MNEDPRTTDTDEPDADEALQREPETDPAGGRSRSAALARWAPVGARALVLTGSAVIVMGDVLSRPSVSI